MAIAELRCRLGCCRRHLGGYHATKGDRKADVVALGRLQSLRDVQLSSLIQLASVEPLSSLFSLTTLTLEYCRALDSLQGLGELPKLNYLSLDGCDSLTRCGLWALAVDAAKLKLN